MARFNPYDDDDTRLSARDLDRARQTARKRARQDKHAELTFRGNPLKNPSARKTAQAVAFSGTGVK